jgi:hypothetical protein
VLVESLDQQSVAAAAAAVTFEQLHRAFSPQRSSPWMVERGEQGSAPRGPMIAGRRGFKPLGVLVGPARSRTRAEISGDRCLTLGAPGSNPVEDQATTDREVGAR